MTPDVVIGDNHHRRVDDRMSMVRIFIGGAISMCGLTVVAVVTLALARPESGSTMATVIGFTTPVTMGLLAAGLQGIHKGIEGRFSQLLVTTAERTELETRAQTIRDLQLKLEQLAPNTPEHTAILDQLKVEALKPFTIYERRR